MKRLVVLTFLAMLSGAAASAQDWVSVIPASGTVPTGAFKAGVDTGGGPLYFIRFPYQGGVVVGKYDPLARTASISYGGKEIQITTDPVEIFVGFGFWFFSADGSPPPNAIVGGNESDGSPLYMIAGTWLGNVTCGKYSSEYAKGYVPFEGKEIEETRNIYFLVPAGSGSPGSSRAGQDPPPVRLSFAPGATSGVVKGALDPDQTRTYLVGASAGQPMIVSVDSPSHDATISVIGKDGTVLLDADRKAAYWQGLLQATEDYLVQVYGGTQAEGFTLSVSTPARMTIAPDSPSPERSGVAPEGENLDFVVRGNAGEKLTIDLGPNGIQDAAVLRVYGLEDNETYLSSDAGRTSFDFSAPSTQDYVVELVRKIGAEFFYDLRVSSPQANGSIQKVSGQRFFGDAGYLWGESGSAFVMERTPDAGKTWNPVDLASLAIDTGSLSKDFSGLPALPYVHFSSLTRGWMVWSTDESEIHVASTQDGGATWSRAVNFSTDAIVEYEAFPGPGRACLLAEMPEGMMHTTLVTLATDDDGATWSVDSSFSGDGAGAIVFRSPTDGFIPVDCPPCGYFLFYRTEDGGKSWNTIDLPLPQGVSSDDFNGTWLGAPVFQGPDRRQGKMTVKIGLASQGITVFTYTTSDGGDTWAVAPSAGTVGS